MLIGIVVGTLVTMRLAVKRGIPADFVYTTAFWIVLAGLIGARLTHVLDSLDFYADHPSQIFAFWQGGLGWYGGLLGGTLAGVICARVSKIPLGRFADAVALGGFLGLAIGRIGCTLNGCDYGIRTSFPGAVIYTHPNSLAPIGVPVHPTQVYELIYNLIVFVVLVKLRGRFKPDGSLFLIYLSLYSLWRVLISFLSEGIPFIFGIQQAQFIGIVVLALAVFRLVSRTQWITPEDKNNPEM